jgi:hypothetical protein
MAAQPESTEVLYGERERSEVRQQLDRLLLNAHFSHSKRFPSFLRFIVQEELEGRGDQLKERTLGVEVFGRDAGYDTTSDPIVRVTAAEIRKRIAQYYQDCGNPDELRISLPPGSYVPHFEWPRVSSGNITATESSEHTPVFDRPVVPVVEASTHDVRDMAAPDPPRKLWAIAVVLLTLGIAVWAWMHLRRTTLESFWSPVLSPGESVVVCFPQGHINGITLRDAANPLQQNQLTEQMNAVVLDDLQPLVSLAGLLEMRHQRYSLRGEDATTLTDLRQGPAIFLGAFDNPWTLRLTRGLRFRFGNDPEMTRFWIEDTEGPERTHWAIDRKVQEATNNYRDYAIVARFRDANTGQIAVVVAGIARGGTIAAGEFLTQAADMDAVRSQVPKGWEGQNMEFVLSTEIIDGRPSPPKVEKTYFW